MARKKKSGIPPATFKVAVPLIGLALLIGGGIYGGRAIVSNIDYFKVKIIQIDLTLDFINKRDLSKLIGENIFRINLIDLQKKLQYKYPQIAGLKILRELPNQITIEARKRVPFAQTRLRNRTLTLDDRGFVISATTKENEKFPFILGLSSSDLSFSLGFPLRGKNVHTALRVLREFRQEKKLSSYDINKISIENLSKIDMYLSNRLQIILDQDNIQRKMDILGVVLTRGDLNFKDIRYVDLRFKEPIIGKKK